MLGCPETSRRLPKFLNSYKSRGDARFTPPLLEFDGWLGKARLRAIEKEPHAQSVGALRCNQAHLTANVIDVVQAIQLRFILIRIPLQACNSPLDRLPEPRTDLETLLDCALTHHDRHLGTHFLRLSLFERPQVSSDAADTTEAEFSAPDYGLPESR